MVARHASGPLALTLLVVATLVHCTVPRTEVIIEIDTDAPARITQVAARVARGTDVRTSTVVAHTWLAPIAFPASFAILPDDESLSTPVTLGLDAALRGTTDSDPSTTLHRVARFTFLRGARGVVRLFLAAGCASPSAIPCPGGVTPCTRSDFCAALDPPQTCGDEGTCVPPDVTPVVGPVDPPVFDAIDRVDATSDVNVEASSDACAPNCLGRTCGTDGCGGSCGTCPAGIGCDATGQCECTPDCNGRQCGTDGCGGVCGTCPTGRTCTMDGQCTCVRDCGMHECGPDGCGGTCGLCNGGTVCSGAGVCVISCTPDCAGRACGSDGCAGRCGTCATGQSCSTTGQCVCEPDCTGRTCGSDGCGGSCGTCRAGQTCTAGTCGCAGGCGETDCGTRLNCCLRAGTSCFYCQVARCGP